MKYENVDPHTDFELSNPSNTDSKDFDDHIPLQTDEHLQKETESFQSKFFNMLFILALLIGFMILASWALKRMMKAKITNLNSANSIKILETRYLSPRATLYLIEVEDQSYLIAESPNQVSHLAKISSKNFSSLNEK